MCDLAYSHLVNGVVRVSRLGPRWRGLYRKGTPILTPGGAVAVENLKPGDVVLGVKG